MKKLFWIPVFLIVAFAGDRLLGWLLQNQLNASQFRYSRMYRGEGQADIVVIGNSKGLNLLIPTIEESTGQKAFSLCYNGMPGNLGAVLVEDYIDQYPSVKTVVVELCMAELADKQLISEFSSYSKNSNRIDSLIKVTNKLAWTSSQLSHLYRFNNEVFQRGLYYRNRLDNDWSMDRTITDRMKQEANQYKVEFKSDPKELLSLKKITDYCKSKNINVKLLITPFYPDVVLINIDTFKSKITEYTGLPVYDYSKAVKSDEFFGDFLHLNQKGSEAFVRQIAKEGALSEPVATSLLISK